MWIPVLGSGDYDLYIRGGDGEEDIIDSVSLIIGNNSTNNGSTEGTITTCSQCKKRKHLTLVYDVTDFVTPTDFKSFNLGYPNNKGSKVIQNLFVRHKGEDYFVNTNDKNKRVLVKSVKGARSHKKKIRKSLRNLNSKLQDAQKKRVGPKWDCRGGGNALVE